MSTPSSRPRRSRYRLIAAGIAAVGLLATTAWGTALAATTGQSTPPPGGPAPDTALAASTKLGAFYDSRQDSASRKVLNQRTTELAAAVAKSDSPVKTLRTSLGVQGVVDIDPLTKTLRSVAKLDGFLTGPSALSATKVTESYLADHTAALGLSSADISGLHLRTDYVDIGGTHHLSYQQLIHGVPVFGNGVKAAVSSTGELINVQGSPVSGVQQASVSAATLTADAARGVAARDLHAAVKAAQAGAASGADQITTFSNGDRAQQVMFQTIGGLRLAWQTLSKPGTKLYLHVVDAATGRVLYRQSLSSADNADVYDNRPGASIGGKAHTVDLTKAGWLPANSPWLAGNFAHVYSDVNDDNLVQRSEEILPSKPGSFVYPFKAVQAPNSHCSAAYPCAWNPYQANSWKTNRAQSGAQLFYFISNFHDHLKAAPIGFTRQAGNFEALDGDAVQGQTMDGADTAKGLPDSPHVDNANMNTPPDGQAPTLQMYLWHDPADVKATKPADKDPFVAADGSDEADFVYHEYTHGLSGRLVVDANGVSTLGQIQSGAMSEAWSDWYAFDYLANSGLVLDSKGDGDLRVGSYVGQQQNLIRSEPLDCSVGSKAKTCPGTQGAGPGGYTYGDFGKVSDQPEVHSDGEIWGQTLWQLRSVLGSKLAESLITRAMELSPSNPSFLDERNAILQADRVATKGKNQAAIWRVFANRGMGFFAAAVNGDDRQPVENFSLPPAANAAKGSLSGVITDDSGQPAAGVTVAFGGHASGFPGDYAAVSDSKGKYTINGIFVGTYPKVAAAGGPYEPVVRTVKVAKGTNSANWQVRHDWAALVGGATVAAATGADLSILGCGPTGLFDLSRLSGWVTDVKIVDNAAEPRSLVVKLPAAVDVSEISIDPTAPCGAGVDASVAGYQVETSANGTDWTPAAAGTFGKENLGKDNSVPLKGTVAGVAFVRFTVLSPQVPGGLSACTPDAQFDGCSAMGAAELTVHGRPAA